MKPPLHFYFDFTSPYGYLAATKIDELAAQYLRTVEWHPILLGAIFKTTGSVPLMDIPLKGAYSRHDLERTARFHHIPFTLPKNFPISTVNTARAMLWIANKLGKASAVNFAKAAYRAYFVNGTDIDDLAQIAQLATQLGLDGNAVVSASSDQAIKDQLKAEVASAQSQGVFGSPFVIVDGESFWGFDRFDQLEALLKNGQV